MGSSVWGFVNSDERLKFPLIRKNGEFVRASWDEAIKFASGPVEAISCPITYIALTLSLSIFSIQDIYKSELVMIVGANTAESHPVLATRVKRAHSNTVSTGYT